MGGIRTFAPSNATIRQLFRYFFAKLGVVLIIFATNYIYMEKI